MKTLNLPLVLIVLLVSPLVGAQSFDLRVRGFADLVATKTSLGYPLNSIGNKDDKLTTDGETRLGLNLSSELTDDLDFASQILARGNDNGRYQLMADWIFLTYRPVEHIAFRAGRQLLPVFLFAEEIDVGYTYLWPRLPYEFYSLVPVKSANGLGIIATYPIGHMTFRTELLGGGGDLTIGTSFNGSTDNTKVIEMSLSSDEWKVHAAYMSSDPRGTLSVPIQIGSTPGPTYGTLVQQVDIGRLQVGSVGASFDSTHAFAVAEILALSSTGTLVHKANAGYLSLGYHLFGTWTPYLTHSWQGDLNGSGYIFPDSTVSTTPRKEQTSEMIGVNYKFNSATAVKAEYMKTFSIFQDSSRNLSADTLTASLDVIF